MDAAGRAALTGSGSLGGAGRSGAELAAALCAQASRLWVLRKAVLPFLQKARTLPQAVLHRNMERFGLEGTLMTVWFQPPN